ncbi:SRPBCC domain-containing protein [Amycolatopsis silviterrae]|uniref:SRPBCC domain-containing protein n=1 Tax=Amycolatopsis silviterrae TaxID=1656914 RepID=A0ABW5HGH5_9PSEU
MTARESDIEDGVVEARPDGSAALVFARRLDHPVERVWQALTDVGLLSGWWGAAERLELVEGGQFVLRWLNSDEQGNQVVLHGKVTRLEPPRLLEYDTDVHGTLTFALRPADSGTALTFSSTVRLPAESHPVMLAGWHMHLGFLVGLLDGRRADLVNLPLDDWARWRDRYEEAAR